MIESKTNIDFFEDSFVENKLFNFLKIEESVKNCTKCQLHKNRNKIVFYRGSIDAKFMLVGEAPGADEDSVGKPFVGRAGKLLDASLQECNINQDEIVIVNIVKCRPPNNRQPEIDEILSCMPYLKQQIELLSPKIIVALGSTAVQGLTGISGGITSLRGKLQLYANIPVMPTFHPAYILRNPKAKIDFINDLSSSKQKLINIL